VKPQGILEVDVLHAAVLDSRNPEPPEDPLAAMWREGQEQRKRKAT
jgi:hypothetical protein